ncbi:MAG: TetR/AcrR family transcriptional regulator [Clostridiales bacterium]|jgi:AcrR family transcriptional regulator|nr:TetR/AcrR family transcriptional regulator [Clostridiales bacterium]
MYNEEHEDCQKFLHLETEKRERILNAAMREFLHGFKKASTDNIVREAGISKGLLFHYFGTKENLFDFLIDYAIDIIQTQYMDLINVRQKDIFDALWQMALLKRDVSQRFPVIFEFLSGVYLDSKDCPAKQHLKKFKELQTKIYSEIYEHCDKTLFREDIDPQKVVDIVHWSLAGWADSKTVSMTPESVGTEMSENYDLYLDEMKEYLDIFHKCFYK